MMADSDLQRTHPATVAVRTLKTLWQMVAGLLVLVVFGTLGDGASPAFGLAALIGLGVIVTLGFSWVTWWRFGYGIVGTDLLIVEGLFVRKRRTIPIARVHGVNMKADPFMRMLGLVEIVVQTAGGGAKEPEARIGAIPLDRAEELRNALLHNTPGRPATEPVALDPVGRISDFRGAFGGVESGGHEVLFEHKVPTGLLVVGAVTSNRVPIIIAVGVGVLAQGIEIIGDEVIEQTASRAAEFAVPVLVALVAAAGLFVGAVAVGVGLARDFGFTTRRYDTRVEIEAGLLERRQVSMPVGRIQAVRIEESWLRRLLGLAAIEVDTAGLERTGQQANEATRSKAMVPVARAADVADLMHRLLPEAEQFPPARGLPSRALRFYVVVPTLIATALTLVAVVPASWFLYRPALPWGVGAVALVGLGTAASRVLHWRRAGVGTDDAAVTLRSGGLGIKRVRLARSRIQSLDVCQNPFQRRAKLASLRTVSVSGSSKAIYGVSHLDETEALRIMHWYEHGLAGPRSPAVQSAVKPAVEAPT
jgi:putative membrane protein